MTNVTRRPAFFWILDSRFSILDWELPLHFAIRSGSSQSRIENPKSKKNRSAQHQPVMSAPTMSKPNKISTDGGQALAQNPFGGLVAPGSFGSPPPAGAAAGTAAAAAGAASGTAAGTPPPPPKQTAEAAKKNRGRVDVTREKAGRGGKTVTVASGFTGIGPPEKEQLAKKMRAACGTGGTVKDGRIEIQGDKRDEIARILTEAGFRVVFAGG
jgi:translation initiation factor 1